MKIQSRITVFVAIGSMFALMGGLFVYVDNTPSLQKAQIELYEVELLSVNTEENSAELSVSFMITNPSDTTFTCSQDNVSLRLWWLLECWSTYTKRPPIQGKHTAYCHKNCNSTLYLQIVLTSWHITKKPNWKHILHYYLSCMVVIYAT